jgi:hypothetical protein
MEPEYTSGKKSAAKKKNLRALVGVAAIAASLNL